MLTYFSNLLSGGVEPFWPHVWLLSLSVVASAMVGLGIIFERPKYSESVHRVAFWLVVTGIVVEALCTITLFVFDEGISSAQQSKIISLEKEMSWRKLSDGQKDILSRELADRSFEVLVNWRQDAESGAFAWDIAVALGKIGLKPTMDTFTPSNDIGLVVIKDKDGNGEILMAALQKAGLKVVTNPNVTLNGSVPRLVIGSRPEPVFGN